MSVGPQGNFPLDFSSGQIPSIDQILASLGDYDIPNEALDLLTNYLAITMLQNQIGQTQLGFAQNDLGMAQVGLGQAQVGQQMAEIDYRRDYELPVRQAESDARLAEIDYRTQYEIPFKMEELENSRILADLNLQLQQSRADNERMSNAEELQQLRERGQYDTKLQALGLEQALVNLSRDREAANRETAANRRGSGRFTPRQVDSYGGIRF